jgi:Ser/Thr protein kinase RdoA (MazF antagonist)
MTAKSKTILFIFVAFLLGGVAGGVLVHRYWPDFRPSRPEAPKDALKAFAARLHLEPRQMAEVDSLLELRRQRFEAYRSLTMASRDSTRQEIRKILTPEQNKLFDDYIQEMNSREERYRSANREHR